MPSDMPRPRVLIFQTHAENSGTQEVSRQLNAGLTARGYDVHELFFVRATRFLHAGPNVIVCALPPRHGVLGYVRMAILTFTQMRRLKPDVVLCTQWGGTMLSAFVAPFTGSPLIIANQFTVPVVPPLARWIDKMQGTLGLFSRIVVNSQDVESEYAGHPKAYRRRLIRIEHGFKEKKSALSKMEARAELALPQNVTLLGSVGRLARSKNLDSAVKLLTQNPQWHLALAGHGPEENKLRDMAAAWGCADRLHLPSEIHPDRVGDFLAALDVFVFPSVAETFGLAVVEAAQAGVPVVANDLEVLREVLAVDGEACALFVDVGNSAQFADAVSRVLTDADLRQQMTERGMRLKDRYPLDKMFDDYDRLIKDALREARPAKS